MGSLIHLLYISTLVSIITANKHASQLYEDLMYDYNKNVRPVKNSTQPVIVQFGASLIRIIDVVSTC